MCGFLLWAPKFTLSSFCHRSFSLVSHFFECCQRPHFKPKYRCFYNLDTRTHSTLHVEGSSPGWPTCWPWRWTWTSALIWLLLNLDIYNSINLLHQGTLIHSHKYFHMAKHVFLRICASAKCFYISHKNQYAMLLKNINLTIFLEKRILLKLECIYILSKLLSINILMVVGNDMKDLFIYLNIVYCIECLQFQTDVLKYFIK